VFHNFLYADFTEYCYNDMSDFSVLKFFETQTIGLFKSSGRCLTWDGLKLIMMELLEVVRVILLVVTFLEVVVVITFAISLFTSMWKMCCMPSLWTLFWLLGSHGLVVLGMCD